MIPTIKLSVQGFSKDIRPDERVRNQQFHNIKPAIRFLDGHKLDEINLYAILESREDVIDLIALLEIAQYCFLKKLP